MSRRIDLVSQYKDTGGKWRWRIIDLRGRVIGRSHVGYMHKVDCSTNMHRVSQAMTPPIEWDK